MSGAPSVRPGAAAVRLQDIVPGHWPLPAARQQQTRVSIKPTGTAAVQVCQPRESSPVPAVPQHTVRGASAGLPARRQRYLPACADRKLVPGLQRRASCTCVRLPTVWPAVQPSQPPPAGCSAFQPAMRHLQPRASTACPILPAAPATDWSQACSLPLWLPVLASRPACLKCSWRTPRQPR